MTEPDARVETLGKKYRVIEPIGRGGMGEVYRAEDLRLQRHVALKYLRTDIDKSHSRADIAREARMLARLSHPNIVQVYDLVEDDDRPVLVMELVEGRNLHHHIREHRCDQIDRLRWLAEIAAGIAAAHAAGITHNDLKAENVLIGADNRARVTDFGIASDGADESADVLALGRLAQRLLCDEAGLPPQLGNTVNRLVHSHAAKRPRAEEAAGLLRHAWLNSTQEETRTPVEPTSPPGTPRRWYIAIILVVLAVAGSALYWKMAPQDAPLYVAVLPTVLEAPPMGSSTRQDFLRSAVEQSLRQSAVDTQGIALVSERETREEKGGLADIASALGADELVISSLSCGEPNNCSLELERLGGENLSVLAHASTEIFTELVLETHNIVGRQWVRLYPEGQISASTDSLNEATYRRYLELYALTHMGGARQRETHERLESLLGEATRFLPLYLLYAHSALNVYDETGDVRFLQELREVLNYAESWAGQSNLLKQAWVELALEEFDFDLAAVKIDEIAAQGGDEVLINRLKGDLYRYQSLFPQAEKHYKKALSLRGSRALYNKLADTYRLWSKSEKAIETYRQSLALYPYGVSDKALLGLTLIEQGELDEAIAVLESIGQDNPTALYLSDLGLAYMLKGDYDNSARVLRSAYAGGVRDPILILNLADAEALSGNLETAADHYTRLIRDALAKPGSVRLSTLSQAYAQLGNFEEAIETLDRITDVDSQTAFNAALVFTLAGQTISALLEVDKALQRDFGAVWFRLPWFDALCTEPRFRTRMSEAGMPERCLETARSGGNQRLP